MDRINLLLANADRRTRNLVESIVHDACYNQVVLECARTARVDELAYEAWSYEFQLVILAADTLQPEPSRRGVAWVQLDEILLAIRNIKSHRVTWVIVTGATPENEFLILEAGADAVLLRPLVPEKLKFEVRRVLELTEVSDSEEAAPSRWSLSGALFRGFQRLTNA
jgi:DNA-binding response OmpR family regulator